MPAEKGQSGPEGQPTSPDGFREFDRILPENCVEYMLFIIDSNLDSGKAWTALDAVRKAAVHLSDELTKEYIWQRDAFNLEITTQERLTYLHGITDYGDAIEDEWLVVYVLRELTKKFPKLWVRVFDSDGEFLLVEAASVLPKWLSPEIDANRAWIHEGRLRIAPLAAGADVKKSKSLTLPEALGVIKTSPDSLIHSTFVEAEAFYRLDQYPQKIQESIHYATVTIPRRLAYVVHEIPKAIAPAVEEFYLRDPAALKPLMSSSTDSLTFPPKDLVTVSVRFTKVLYAQLRSQHFSAPPAWQDVLPSSETSEGAKPRTTLELGMKVACAFEMLAARAAKKNDRTSREVALLLGDLEEDGDQVLPTDAQMRSWKDVDRDDDDSWMDVNFEDFERELGGSGKKAGAGASGGGAAFSNASAQADLRKIVSRFEAFLNDDKAGIDGAEFDEMDEDDDEDDEEDDDEEDGEAGDDEDFDVSFDEEEFARMMREMMGLPAEGAGRPGKSKDAAPKGKAVAGDQDKEDDEIRKLAEQMEAELNEHGALDLEPTPKKLKALKGEESKPQGGGSPKDGAPLDADEESDEDGEVDIDYNLVKNMLEGFKGQAGMAGPVSTLLAGLDIRLPRDDEDGSEH